jgi:hypothetical protein
LHIVQGIRRVDGEADEDNVRIRVREWSEAVVIFLACSIPQSKFDVLSVHLDIRNVIFEDRWDVDLFVTVVSVAIDRDAFVVRQSSTATSVESTGVWRRSAAPEMEELTSGKVPLEKTLKKENG